MSLSQPRLIRCLAIRNYYSAGTTVSGSQPCFVPARPIPKKLEQRQMRINSVESINLGVNFDYHWFIDAVSSDRFCLRVSPATIFLFVGGVYEPLQSYRQTFLSILGRLIFRRFVMIAATLTKRTHSA